MPKSSYSNRTVQCALLGAAAAICLAGMSGCGQNVFKSEAKSDPAEQATLDLEAKNPGGAINVLTAALVKDPGNAQYLSILATAYAQRAGIDPLQLGLKLSGSSSSLALAATLDSITSLFPLLPDASAQNLSDVDEAVSILNTQISPAVRQPGDLFKTAIYMTASMVLHTKQLDTLGTGTLTVAEIANLSDASANAILANLTSAATLLGQSGSSTGSTTAATAAATAALAKYSTQINAEPGATPAAKLRNYLAANPSAAGQTVSGTGSGT